MKDQNIESKFSPASYILITIMKFSIIIPAYNEERSIGATIERSLQARERIRKNTAITDIEVIVVNDGSTDRTEAIARSFKEIQLISTIKNRGYGAAIKQGFAIASGELLGFIDADGTCDPEFFADLINALQKEHADIALGSRLGPGSRMPRIRRLGNIFFSKLINFLGNVNITDSASGMRVLRASALKKIYPLPDGLNFTPAMSSKALLHKDLKIIEHPMAYQEREGHSKLEVIKDGWRFLQVILEMALFYKPLKLFMAIGFTLIALGAAYAIMPIVYYLAHQRIEEHFIYRLISIIVFLLVGTHFLICGIFAERFVRILHQEVDLFDQIKNMRLRSLLKPKVMVTGGISCSLIGILLNGKVMVQYFTTGHITQHWIYVLTGAMLVLFGMEIFTFGFLHKIIEIYKENKTG